MTMGRYIQIGAAVGLLLVVTTVAALAQSEGGTSPPGEGVPQITQIPPAAVDAMAILGTARTSTDALPTAIAEPMDAHAQFGINPALSREAMSGYENTVYVLPGDGYVCGALTVADGANMSCQETANVAEGLASPTTVTLPDGDIAIYGIVPDGVENVALDTGENDSVVHEVDDNAYLAVAPAQTVLRAVRYTGPSGHVEFPIYDPAVAFDPEG
jgi:hypothetical protein